MIMRMHWIQSTYFLIVLIYQLANAPVHYIVRKHICWTIVSPKAIEDDANNTNVYSAGWGWIQRLEDI